MSSPGFVHLRLHSEFSIADGAVRIDDAVDAAVADRMPALALTDLANQFGLVKFYRAARARGIKPIAGCDVWIANERDPAQPTRALLLASIARRLPAALRLAVARVPDASASRPRATRSGVVR